MPDSGVDVPAAGTDQPWDYMVNPSVWALLQFVSKYTEKQKRFDGPVTRGRLATPRLRGPWDSYRRRCFRNTGAHSLIRPVAKRLTVSIGCDPTPAARVVSDRAYFDASNDSSTRDCAPALLRAALR
ncbi:hypothetical protein MTO96_019014 [Rhipicephalus appendiculatus]